MTDTEGTVRRFLEGDEEAFNQIVRQWERQVFNIAWRYLGNREDAQDVVQDTFLSVFKSLRSLREPKSFPSWLYRIALNHCRGRWRSQSADISLDDTDPDSRGGRNESSTVLQAEQSLEKRLETVDLIRKALMGVSDAHRAAIILKEYVGLNLEEVAQVMDCPLSTAKSRLYHGLRQVQRNLKRIGVKS